MSKPPIIDGTVTCPCGCKHTFEVAQHASTGAQAAKHQTTLSLKQSHILNWWKGSYPENQNAYTKRELYDKYTKAANITFGSFEARISELLGLELLAVAVEEITDHTGPQPNTTRAPKYELNWEVITNWQFNDWNNPNKVEQNAV